MKVISLGSITHTKLCHLKPGEVVTLLENLEPLDGHYLVTSVSEKGIGVDLVKLETGEPIIRYSSSRCIRHPDACIVLNPIDNS